MGQESFTGEPVAEIREPDKRERRTDKPEHPAQAGPEPSRSTAADEQGASAYGAHVTLEDDVCAAFERLCARGETSLAYHLTICSERLELAQERLPIRALERGSMGVTLT